VLNDEPKPNNRFPLERLLIARYAPISTNRNCSAAVSIRNEKVWLRAICCDAPCFGIAFAQAIRWEQPADSDRVFAASASEALYLQQFQVANLAKVADLNRLVHEQRDTAYEVLKRFLCGKRYRQSPDAEVSPHGRNPGQRSCSRTKRNIPLGGLP
jgi:hypothetical protein